MVYFAYVHSIMSYGIIFRGNQPYSQKIFKIQKRVIRINTNSRTRDSCGELFKKLEILPLCSQYIFSLSIFVIKNSYFIQIIRSIVSTQDLKPTYTHLQQIYKVSKGLCTIQELKSVTTFLTILKTWLMRQHCFGMLLKRFLLINSFYNNEEYFNYQR